MTFKGPTWPQTILQLCSIQNKTSNNKWHVNVVLLVIYIFSLLYAFIQYNFDTKKFEWKKNQQDYSFKKKTKQDKSTSSTHTESLLLIHTCFPEDTVCQLCFKNIVQG